MNDIEGEKQYAKRMALHSTLIKKIFITLLLTIAMTLLLLWLADATQVKHLTGTDRITSQVTHGQTTTYILDLSEIQNRRGYPKYARKRYTYHY